jgi:hypothetical protein
MANRFRIEQAQFSFFTGSFVRFVVKCFLRCGANFATLA